MIKGWAYNIAKYLKQHEGENILISDIVNDLRISRSTVSDNLGKLIRDGYVQRNGKRYIITRNI